MSRNCLLHQTTTPDAQVTHPDADGSPIRPCQLTGTCPKSTEKDAPTGLGGVGPAKLTVPAPAAQPVAKPVAKPAAKKAPLALASEGDEAETAPETAPEHKGMVSSMSQHMGKSMSYTGKGCRADPNGVFVIQANGETQFIRANEQVIGYSWPFMATDDLLIATDDLPSSRLPTRSPLNCH